MIGALALANERCDIKKIPVKFADVFGQVRKGIPGKATLKGCVKHYTFKAGERIWVRYDYGKRCVAADKCYCPDHDDKKL